MYSLYILRSRATGRYYVGSTEDLPQRLRQHNGELPSLGISTISGRPWQVVYSAAYVTRRQALAAERYVKKMKSRHSISKLIAGGYRLPEF